MTATAPAHQRVVEGRDEHQHLRDERREAGQAAGREAGDQERPASTGADFSTPPISLIERRAAALDQEAGDQEQRGGRDAVVDHVEDRAGAALGW